MNNDADKYLYEKVEKVHHLKSYSYNRIYGIKSSTRDILETRRPINAGEYLRLVDKLNDISKEALTINRTTFVYKNQ